jgi:N-acetylmuramoyl-L-alanine amidase
MKILRHRLHDAQGDPVKFTPSKNMGGALQPEYLVIHYTAGSTAAGAIDWLTRRDSRVSAHLVIARDGVVTQLVPFNKVAFHAGASQWEGRVGLNNHSIGIELDNAGRLIEHGENWRSSFGKEYTSEDVLGAIHKNDRKDFGWHLYSEEQIWAVIEVGLALFNRYDLIDVVGHDDISPGRKWDPGPAFPMESVRSRLVGREQDEPTIYVFSGPRFLFAEPDDLTSLLPGRPLPKGTKVEIANEIRNWREVFVVDEDEDFDHFQGWIHVRHLHRLRSDDSSDDE